MFYDGEFRDWDSTTGQPIVIPGYFDVMMQSTPLACGMATEQQTKLVGQKLKWFFYNPSPWFEWT